MELITLSAALTVVNVTIALLRYPYGTAPCYRPHRLKTGPSAADVRQ